MPSAYPSSDNRPRGHRDRLSCSGILDDREGKKGVELRVADFFETRRRLAIIPSRIKWARMHDVNSSTAITSKVSISGRKGTQSEKRP